MSDWPDCIVSFFDLEGISIQLQENSQRAIRKMRDMHREVFKISNADLHRHDFVYFWNDSVLLLALDCKVAEYQSVMQV